MKTKMIAKQTVSLPFVMIKKGDEVVVEDSLPLFGQNMKAVSVETEIGLFTVHMSSDSVNTYFAPVEPVGTETKPMDRGLVELLNVLGMGKVLGQEAETKPRVRVAPASTKFFVLKDFQCGSVSASVGEVLEVIGHKGECPIVRFPDNKQAQLDKNFYNLVMPMTIEHPYFSINELKAKHYRTQGFVSSGGLLVKRIDDRCCQVVKEENLDVVRVLVDNKLAKVISVDWSKNSVHKMA